MSTSAPFDDLLDRVNAGTRLAVEDLARLAETPDILPLGMLADTVRRQIHGTRATYVRVALCAFDAPIDVPPAAREVRITGSPEGLEPAVRAIAAAREAAGGRAVSAYAWSDIERLSAASGSSTADVLARLKAAGLETVAHVPLDLIDSPVAVLTQLMNAGYERVRLTIEKANAESRGRLFRQVAALQDQFGCIQAVSPLPMALNAFRPTTGYDDVKSVALARLAAPNVPSVQVDWLRYGPKLAQVALTFGADDIDNVTAGEEAPDGRRRAPLEEVRRNISAAGLEPAERDGRFAVLS